MKKRVGEAEGIPFGYGFSYWDLNFYAAVCYPIPLNILVAWLRKVYMIVTYPLGINKGDSAIMRAYVDGLHEGFKQGHAAGYHSGQDAMFYDVMRIIGAGVVNKEKVICAEPEPTANIGKNEPTAMANIGPAREGRKWTEEEDKQLEGEFFLASQNCAELAKKHGRSVGAIRSRVSKLGLNEAR
jgi:hypothetical protein